MREKWLKKLQGEITPELIAEFKDDVKGFVERNPNWVKTHYDRLKNRE